MARLSKVPCFLSFSPVNHDYQQEECRPCSRAYIPEKRFRICACSIKKPPSSRRRVKSNVELCNDIREFVSAVGLPEGHVPSFKELSDHGRNDLAYIVRRRGYKVIRDLLSNSTEADTVESSVDKNLAEQDAISDIVDVPTGQDEELKSADVLEDGLLSTEVHSFENNFGNSEVNPEYNSDGHSSEPSGSSVTLLLEEKNLYHVQREDSEVESAIVGRSLSTPLNDLEEQNQRVDEDNSLSVPYNHVEQEDNDVVSMVVDSSSSAEVSVVECDDSLDRYSETSANFSSGEEPLHYTKGQDVGVNEMAEEISLSTGVSKAFVGTNHGDDYHMSMESTTSSSLEEKVAKFIKTGDLDAIDDNIYDVLDVRGTNESTGYSEPENVAETQLNTLPEQNVEHAEIQSNISSASNGRLSSSMQVTHPVTVHHPLRNENLFAEDPARDDVDKDLETNKKGDQVEISNLKFMLNQKELELSRLKEQIEKEKLALSALQTKAEAEIAKAQKLISEKDAELLAAEENLSELVEVNVQYYGDGEIVEVAGSFNGWQHRIKMDPQQSSTITDPIGSRKPRVWSTMLWLYPGVYEIKFIVDGNWRLDPQRESVNRGGMCNNILRVER